MENRIIIADFPPDIYSNIYGCLYSAPVFFTVQSIMAEVLFIVMTENSISPKKPKPNGACSSNLPLAPLNPTRLDYK